MNVTVKTLPKSEVKLTVEVPVERMMQFLDRATNDISQHVKIPGFRPGHVPYDVLVQQVSKEAIENHAIDLALPEAYSEAIVKEEIQAVSRPKINILQPNPLKFEATVAVYPEVKISGYDKINIKKHEPKVDDKELEDFILHVRKRHATYKPVDLAAKKGDRVEIDFEGFDEGGAALEKTKSSNHPLTIGEGSLVKGFEDELEGMKTGEKKSFKVTFPKDYFHKPFQGKKVEFKVEMKKVEEVVLPEMTPEFIKSLIGESKTLDELKAMTRENLLHDKKREEKIRHENEFLEKIIDLTKIEVPEALIEEEIDGMMDEMKSELEQRGIPWDKYLAETKKELKALRDERGKEAEKRLKLRFGLQQIFEQEKIEISKDELQKEVNHIVGLYPEKEQAKVRQEYAHEGGYLLRRLENKLKMDKLFSKFLK